MFSLASGVYQSYFATPQINVLLIGMEGVGKTTLLERLKVTQFSKRQSSVSASSNNNVFHPNQRTGTNTVGSNTTTTATKSLPSAYYARAKRSLACPAPSKYANAKVMDDDDDDQDEEYHHDDDDVVDGDIIVLNHNNNKNNNHDDLTHNDNKSLQQQQQRQPPPISSRNWLSERDHSSLEDVEWTTSTTTLTTKSTTTNTKSNPMSTAIEDEGFSREPKQQEPIEQLQQCREKQNRNNDYDDNDSADEEMYYRTEQEDYPVEDYNLKPNHKMLPLEKIRPTSGQNLAKIELCGAKCHIFDLCGKFRDLWSRYYNDAEAVIFCWNLKGDELQQSILEAVRKQISDDVPILIFGHVLHPNSPDVDFPKTLPTEVFLPNYHSNLMQVFCGSAKTGKGVREAMEWLIPLAKQQAAIRLK